MCESVTQANQTSWCLIWAAAEMMVYTQMIADVLLQFSSCFGFLFRFFTRGALQLVSVIGVNSECWFVIQSWTHCRV